MRDKHTQATTRIWKETLHKFKVVASLQGLSMVEVMDSLINGEIERIMEAEDGRDLRHLLHSV